MASNLISNKIDRMIDKWILYAKIVQGQLFNETIKKAQFLFGR